MLTTTIVSSLLLPTAVLAANFKLETATIADINQAFDAGALTSVQLTQLYLNRINAYDKQGPNLNSIITINPQALETAAALDKERQTSGKRSPLHGIPVILKDNYDTFDLPTTAGSLTLENSIPPDDAFLSKKLRDAGAIILGKANLHEFSLDFTTISSLGGQTRNPYALDRIPGGSSGGTGASIAANFATIGTGTDTAISIRGPASVNNLVGIRPTVGLTSRDGIVPLLLTQDTGGPIARNVTDAAYLLDVLAGYDPNDPATAKSIGKIPESYTDSLDKDGLKGKRIGVIRELVEADIGKNVTDPEIKALVNAAIEDMRKKGAEVFDVEIPNLDYFVRTNPYADLGFQYRSKFDINDYLASRGPDIPYKTLTEILNSGKILPIPSVEGYLSLYDETTVPPEQSPEYQLYLKNKEELTTTVKSVIQSQNLDAFLYPSIVLKPSLIGAPYPEGYPGNALLSSFTGFPALVVPAGFTSDNLPVGIELLGSAFAESTLINIAYSYEQATNHRRLPATTPPLFGEEFEYKYKTVPEPDYILGTIAFASLGVGYEFKRKKKR
ncbi:amidase [Hassallia byssoidea VB512170]|uniref:Amidase n=1 Tax=Hassallia byssoidea VB512170 TaxID=1304833 RepID=A0A846HET0_9CYAN|nr:amidase [Hassalia byssoidea VB512170]